MNEKSLIIDVLVKGANLTKFLTDEKGEKLFSEKLFSSLTNFCSMCQSSLNPAFSKAEVSGFRKSALCEADKITLLLTALSDQGFISNAQKDSMQRTLETVKKEINI